MTHQKTPKTCIAVYPGTFDPVTKGHLDIIMRAAKFVDQLIVAIATNQDKGPLFAASERVEMIEHEIQQWDPNLAKRISVQSFDDLLMHFVERVGAGIIIRGLRAVSDFEYEFQMAGMNTRLNSHVETVFLMASERQQFVSSRFVKEICRLGGDVSSFVPPNVLEAFKTRF